MMFVTGLLTLLAVTYAGGDHIKGMSHMLQEQVAQEDIPSIPIIPFGTKMKASEPSVKTVPSVIQQMEAASKTASAPVLHHTVKTMADRPGKTQLRPAVHHAAKLPLTQDPVVQTVKTIRDPVASPVVQTVKTIRDPVASPVVQTVKTLRDPVASPVVQTVKTLRDPVASPVVQTLKTLRDPVASPVVQTVKTISDPATDSIKTLKTVTKTEMRDPIARPVIQTIKTTDDLPRNLNQKTAKTTIKTSEPSSIVSGVPESIVSAARRNTMRTVLPPEAISPGTLSMPLVAEERGNIQMLNNPGSQLQSGLEMMNDKGEIVLDDETLKLLQNAGGLIKESGEISLNDEAMRILQNIRDGRVSPITTRVSPDNIANVDSEGLPPEPILGTMNLGEARRLSNPNQRQPATGRLPLSRSRSQVDTLQNTASRNNLDLSRGSTGRIRGVTGNDQVLRLTGISGTQRGNFSPSRQGIPLTADLKPSNDRSLLLSGSFGQRVSGSQRGSGAQGMSIQNTGRLDLETSTRNQGSISTATGDLRRSGITTGSRSGVILNSLPSAQRRNTLQRNAIRAGQTPQILGPKPVQDYGFSNLRGSLRYNLQPGTQIGGIPDVSLRAQDSLRGQITPVNDEKILFNGKEISLNGLQTGQLFDENLKPILPGTSDSTQAEGFISSTLNQNIKPDTIRDFKRIASTPRVQTGGISTRGGQQTANIMKEEIKLRIPGGASTARIDDPNLRSNALNPLISSGLSQSLPAVSQPEETIIFNGKEIRISGLRAGQQFDENLQPILTSNVDNTKPFEINPLITSTNVRPASAPGILQGVGIPAVIPNYSPVKPLPRYNAPRRQQAINTPDKLKLIIPNRAENVPSNRINIIPSTSIDSQRTSNIRQTGERANINTALFNGKEIDVSGLRSGQIFDENLQPIMPENPRILSPVNTRTSTVRQYVKPVSGASVTNFASQQRRRQPSAVSIPILRNPQPSILDSNQLNIPPAGIIPVPEINLNERINTRAFDSGIRQNEKILGITSPVQQIQRVSGIRNTLSSNVDSLPLFGGRIPQISSVIANEKLSDTEKLNTLGASDKILFNGQEISISGLRAGQLFDESLRPVSSDVVAPETRNNIATVVMPQGPSLGAEMLKSRERSQLTNSIALGISQGPASVPSPQRSQIISAGASRGTGSAYLQRSPIPGLRRSGMSQPFQTGSTGSERSSAAYQPRQQSGIFSSGLIPSAIPQSSGMSAAPPGALRTNTVLTRQSPGINRGQNIRPQSLPDTTLRSQGEALPGSIGLSAFGTRTGQTVTGNVLRGKEIPLSPELRASIPVQPQNVRRGSLRTNSVRRPQNPVLTAPAIDPVILSAQRTPAVSNAALAGNAGTVLFNGKDIHIGEMREGQLFDANLQPIPSLSFDSAKIDGSPLAIPQPMKPASGIGLPQRAGARRTSLTHGSDVLATRGVAQGQRQASTVTGGELRMRVPVPAVTITGQPGIQNEIPGAHLMTSGVTINRQDGALSNENTILFNGKEINMDGLKAGQIFDANLQPILSSNEGTVITDLRSQGISLDRSRDQRLASSGLRPDSPRQTSPAAAPRRSGSLELRSPVNPRQNSQPLRSTLTNPSPLRNPVATLSNEKTILFNGKEINIDGLKPGQIFDANLQPILSSNEGAVITDLRSQGISLDRSRDQRLAASGLRPDSPRQTSPAAAPRRSGSLDLRSPVNPRQNSQPLRSTLTNPSPLRNPVTTLSNEKTILFNGKEINIDGLKPGQIFDENLQPILSSNEGTVITNLRSQGVSPDRSRDQRLAASGLRPENPRQTPSAAAPSRSGPQELRSPVNPRQNSQPLRSTLTNPSPVRNTVGSGSLRSRTTGGFQRTGTDQGILLTSTATAGAGAPLESSLLSSPDIITAGISDSSLGRTRGMGSNIPIYSSGLGGSNLQRKISQDRISQEVSQVNIENPVIEQKEAGAVLTKVIDPASTKQAQLPLEDILEQKSVSKAHLLKSEQVQETIPFTTSEISPQVTSKTTVTKLSQISQKDADIPIFQQRMMAGDYKNYLPITSFLPPFNYGLPQASQYRVKAPIVQEQQRWEQVFA